MKLLTDHAVLKCGHEGVVQNKPSQQFVTIQSVLVLIADDPVSRNIIACPNYGIGRKPCTSTLAVQTGYSNFVTISGHAVCMETVVGLTDGVDVQPVKYTVRDPAQTFVEAAS